MLTNKQKRLFAIRRNYAKKAASKNGGASVAPKQTNKFKYGTLENIFGAGSKKGEPMKKFIFEGFNDNCDCFNVIAYGKDAKSAAENASKILSKKCGYRGNITVGDIPQKHINPDLYCYYKVGPKGEVEDGFGN